MAEDIKPHNFAGGLSDECIEDMQSLREEYPDMPSKEFVKTAHSRFPSCRKTEDGKSIKWRTLENRIKESHPEIYERHGKDYKPF